MLPGFRDSHRSEPVRSLHDSQDFSSVSFGGSARSRNDFTQRQALNSYSPEQITLIEERLEQLQTLAKFISKDFSIPVLLNAPGKGWHWNYRENIIRVDPEDLLKESPAFLRFVMAHEGAHRRITRFDLVPETLIREPGYSFMSNAIEDPRINNFLVATYDMLARDVQSVYAGDEQAREAGAELAQEKLGYTPKFMLAGFEYISRWYNELRTGDSGELSPNLPDDVKEVVSRTLDAARASWSHYPTQTELDDDLIFAERYQAVSHDINREQIWPHFKKLIEADLKDQRMQELLQELQEEGTPVPWDNWPQLPEHEEALRQELTDEQFQELEDAIAETPVGEAVPLDELSDELKEQLERYLDELSTSDKRRLEEKARTSIRRFEGQLSQDLEKMWKPPEQQSNQSGGVQLPIQMPGASSQQGGQNGTPSQKRSSGQAGGQQSSPPKPTPAQYAEEVVIAPEGNGRRFEQIRKSVQLYSRKLEQELRRIFRDRKRRKKDANYRSGKSISIKRRLREVAKDVSPDKSKAWERKDAPLERDYAISLVIDLTGSMTGTKLKEAFRALATMAEPLERIGINFEILGFNSRLSVFKEFKDSLDTKVKNRLSSLEAEAGQQHSNSTDDGWAVHMASERLKEQKAKRKFLIVVTDGVSNPSPAHAHPYYNIDTVLERMQVQTDQQAIGIGIGSSSRVERHFSQGKDGVAVEELVGHLSKLLEEIIERG